MIKAEVRNWKIGIVNHLHIGKDNIIEVAQWRIGKKLIYQPIQRLCSLELLCEGITITSKDEKKNKLNQSATEFRPRRTASEIKKRRIKDITNEEDDGDIW